MIAVGLAAFLASWAAQPPSTSEGLEAKLGEVIRNPPPHPPSDLTRLPAWVDQTSDGFKMDIQLVDRGRIAVTGSGRCMDRRPGYWYVWVLKVEVEGETPRDLRPILDRNYQDTAFQHPGDGSVLYPTFQDMVDLKPGKYRVDLSLYAIPPSVAVPVGPREFAAMRAQGLPSVFGGPRRITID
jgi:hypothetical protein